MDQILGQDAALHTLQRALDGGRAAHAWVFSGPRGVGKFTAAFALARQLLDTTRDDHPDLHVLRKEDAAWSQNPALQRRKQTNIPIDLVREAIIGGRTSDDRWHDATVFKTPVRGSVKVFIVDEAELLDDTAQNALLKTLEEPPPGTWIILVTSRDDLLLPTVRSRCQGVMFGQVPQEAMVAWAQREGLDPADPFVSWALSHAHGSPGCAQAALDAQLPALAARLRPLLGAPGGGTYDPVWTESLIEFLQGFCEQRQSENSAASKEAANVDAITLVLQVFGEASRAATSRGELDLGAATAAVLSDIESQLAAHLSAKVLLESLVVRWTHLGLGTGTLAPLSA